MVEKIPKTHQIDFFQTTLVNFIYIGHRLGIGGKRFCRLFLRQRPTESFCAQDSRTAIYQEPL